MVGGAILAMLALAPVAALPSSGQDRVTPRLVSIPPISQFYPPRALAAGHEGVTRLRCRLLVAGTLIDCTLQQSSGSVALDEAAFKLASHARYSPMIENGVARDSNVILPIRWVIPG